MLSEEAFEEISELVCSLLGDLNHSQLVEVVGYLKLSEEGGDEDKSTRSLKRRVLGYVNGQRLEKEETRGEILQGLLDEINGWQVSEQIQEPHSLGDGQTTTRYNDQSNDGREQTVAWKKDFKICGQIGEVGHKDRLSFSSLAYQIEQAVKKGTNEREIVWAVIRAIQPGLSLRSYLESRGDITLSTLRRIIRSHYREGEATDLYHQLSNGTQDQKESASHFLVRMLELRQKVLFASQEAGSGLKYDPTLVQSMTRRTLLTGLRDDAVRSEMGPLLKNPSVTDEELFEGMNIAVNQEDERRRKHQQAKKVTKVQVTAEPEPTKMKNESTINNTIEEDVKKLREEVSGLKDLLQSVIVNKSGRRRETGCRACKNNGQGDACNHCFKCGVQGHYSRDCGGNRNQEWGNGRGLSTGGRVQPMEGRNPTLAPPQL